MALWGDAPVRARRRCLPACWACKCSPRRPTGPYRYALDAEACKRDVHASAHRGAQPSSPHRWVNLLSAAAGLNLRASRMRREKAVTLWAQVRSPLIALDCALIARRRSRSGCRSGSSSYLLVCPRISAYLLVSPRISSYLLISPRISSYLLVSPRISSMISSYLLSDLPRQSEALIAPNCP